MCAIFGITNNKEAAYLTYMGLHSLQHRGHEGSGIISTDGQKHYERKRRGLVADIFKNGKLSSLKGNAAIGHTRYSTTGDSNITNLQPLCMKSAIGWTAIAHNGNLVNAAELTAELEAKGSIFQTTTDTEVIIHLMASCNTQDIISAFICALKQVEGAYSVLLLNKEYLIVARDPWGFRPLVMGYYQDYPVFASETCALNFVNAQGIREVLPGEIIVVHLASGRIERVFPFDERPCRKCVFELIYFSRPDSKIFDHEVYQVRKELGKQLAKEKPVEADLVIPVPDSGMAAAIGYAEESKIPYGMGLVRNHYKRSFIEPEQSLRNFGVKLKLTAMSSSVGGKRIIVVDDSLVRGTTSKKIIAMLRDAGALEIHFRIPSPPTISSCFYGIDTPDRQQLIAARQPLEKIRDYIGADTLEYLSVQSLVNIVGKDFCDACFSENYPTRIPLPAIHRA